MGTGVRMGGKATRAKSRGGGKKSLARSLKLFFLRRREFGTMVKGLRGLQSRGSGFSRDP